MYLNYLTPFETVQFAAVMGIGIWGVVAMSFRSARKITELKIMEQRQKDLIPVERRVGNDKRGRHQQDTNGEG